VSNSFQVLSGGFDHVEGDDPGIAHLHLVPHFEVGDGRAGGCGPLFYFDQPGWRADPQHAPGHVPSPAKAT